jgi:hypothetical protein
LPRPGEVELGESVLRRTANRLGIYPTASILASHPSAVLKELIRLEPAIVGGVPGGLSLTAARWTDAEREKVRSAAWPRLVVTGGELLKRQTRARNYRGFRSRRRGAVRAAGWYRPSLVRRPAGSISPQRQHHSGRKHMCMRHEPLDYPGYSGKIDGLSRASRRHNYTRSED